MKKVILLLLVAILGRLELQAQKVLEVGENVKEMKTDEIPDGWKTGGGIGLDLAILNLINPRVGAGDNRLGLGGGLNLFANRKHGKFIWDNRFNLQESMQRIGPSSNPFLKSADQLRLTSQFGYQTGNPKLYVAGLFDFASQLLSTYGVNELKASPTSSLASKFLSPAIIKFAPGLLYKPNSNFKILYSPVAVKLVVVADENLAKIGYVTASGPSSRLGNPWRSATDFDKVDSQLGSQLRGEYNNKFANGRIIYTGILDLYSNYKRDPQNIDVEFMNSIDFVIIKNVSLNVRIDAYYDHDILVQKGGDPNNLARDIFINNAILIKYNTNL